MPTDTAAAIYLACCVLFGLGYLYSEAYDGYDIYSIYSDDEGCDSRNSFSLAAWWKSWQRPIAKSISNNTGYYMFCRTNNNYLTWKKVPVGINLAFITDPGVKKTHLKLPDNQERDILTGEPFALGIGGGEAFLRYAHRTVRN
jgi:hypothetical protein